MPKYFETYSLNLASWLMLKGFQYIDIKFENGKFNIYFDYSQEILIAKEEYRTNKELKKFIYNFTHLRETINDIKLSRMR